MTGRAMEFWGENGGPFAAAVEGPLMPRRWELDDGNVRGPNL
jgi:hypothetical protein